MKIIRQGKYFAVQHNNTNVLENVSFDEARNYLADNGNEDAAQPLFHHSNLVKGEKIIEPEFRGDVVVYLGGRYEQF